MFQHTYEWLHNNYQWIFSGIGVAFLSVVISMIFAQKKASQYQKGGKGSINVQAGTSINLGDIQKKP